MRPTLLVVPFLAALAAPLAAQQRFSVSAHRGYATVSPVLDYRSREVFRSDRPDFAVVVENISRLSVEGAPMTGVRVAVPLRGLWSATLDGAYATTRSEYHAQEDVWNTDDPELRSEESVLAEMDASIGVVALGVARRVPLGVPGGEAEAGLGGTLTRLRLESPPCGPLPPSSGLLGSTCGDLYGPEGDAYDVPGITAHVAVRRRVWSRVGVEGRAAYTLGSASTGSLRDRYRDAPARQAVHGTQLSAGVSIGL